jgi:DNA-binding response OmpR family regulator
MQMAKRILMVDAQPQQLNGLKYTLEQEGYEIDQAADGEEGLRCFRANTYDMVLMDVVLPKMDGLQVCQRIREESNVPIIMISAKGEDMDKILGLEYGADDYMTKPFNILEVRARIRTVLRRAGAMMPPEEKKILRVRDLEVNLLKRTVRLGEDELRLTAKEFDLLHLFITNRGRPFTRNELLEQVWKYDYAGDARTVDVHIRRLREKIERNTAQPEFIMTKWKVGYYFTDED